MFFHQFADGRIQEHHFPDDIRDIYLHGQLLATVYEILSLGPICLIFENLQPFLDKHECKIKYVEGLRLNFLLFVVKKNLFGKTDFKSFLSIWSHNE